eukprot:5416780-Amphidinium_carterae.2
MACQSQSMAQLVVQAVVAVCAISMHCPPPSYCAVLGVLVEVILGADSVPHLLIAHSQYLGGVQHPSN